MFLRLLNTPNNTIIKFIVFSYHASSIITLSENNGLYDLTVIEDNINESSITSVTMLPNNKFIMSFFYEYNKFIIGTYNEDTLHVTYSDFISLNDNPLCKTDIDIYYESSIDSNKIIFLRRDRNI